MNAQSGYLTDNKKRNAHVYLLSVTNITDIYKKKNCHNR